MNPLDKNKDEDKGKSLLINNRLVEEINKLRKNNLELEQKLLKQQKEREGGLSLVEINLELEKRMKEIESKNDEFIRRITELSIQIREQEDKLVKQDSALKEEQAGFLVTLKSLKREKEIIKEEEVVDICRRLVNLKETVEKFQERTFPGYMDSLNLINYLKEEMDRFLMMKNVEQIEVDFREIDRNKVVVVNTAAMENRIIKTGYLINDKLIYPAEVEISPEYNWYLRDYSLNEGFDTTYQKKLREIINESINLQNNLLLEIEKYLVEMEGKHLIIFPIYFKFFFKVLLTKLVEECPEVSHMKISYQKIRNRITEEFRKILEMVPSFDLIRSTRKEIKHQDEEIQAAFVKWREFVDQEIEELKEETKIYYELEAAEEDVSNDLKEKFPWQILNNSSTEDKLKGYQFLRRAKYFLNTFVNQFKKELDLKFGTRKDLDEDARIIFLRGTLPPDLFLDTSASSIDSVIVYLDKLLGVPEEEEFKVAIKDLLLAKGFLDKSNYKKIIRELVKLEFPEDLTKRKELVINLLKKNFK